MLLFQTPDILISTEINAILTIAVKTSHDNQMLAACTLFKLFGIHVPSSPSVRHTSPSYIQDTSNGSPLSGNPYI